MIGMEVDNSIVLGQQEVLEAALSTNPKMAAALRKHIRMVVDDARLKVVQAARGAMRSDPRGTASAVHRSVYKQILGANINIFNARKAGGGSSYEPPRTLMQGQRGGNRVPRGARTQQVMGYGPNQRGFILRFLNSGTYKGDRIAGTSGGALHGNRGTIAARNWFRNPTEQSLVRAVDILANLIEEEIEKAVKQ